MNNNYCDGLDCMYCANTDCPKKERKVKLSKELPSFKFKITETDDEIIVRDFPLEEYIENVITEYRIKKDELITKAILKRMPTTTLLKTVEDINKELGERTNNE